MRMKCPFLALYSCIFCNTLLICWHFFSSCRSTEIKTKSWTAFLLGQIPQSGKVSPWTLAHEKTKAGGDNAQTWVSGMVHLLENKLLQFGRGWDEPDITVLFHLGSLAHDFAKLCTSSYLLLLYHMIVLRYFYLPSYPPVTIILLKYEQEISYFETEKDRKCKIADDLYFK